MGYLYEQGNFMIATFETGSNPAYWSILQNVIGVMDIVADPDWSYSPFSETVELGSTASFGRGFAIVEWHWNGLREVQQEALRAFCPIPNITEKVYICSPSNETLTGDIYWVYALAQLHWPSGDQEKAGTILRDFALRFTLLETLNVQ